METTMIIRGKNFHVKYENGIVSVRSAKNIGWVSAQSKPINDLTDEKIQEMATQTVIGLGLA
ncbi:hypothetical protein [Maribacter dokdonensis]|uniref:hypothetical protein n=1 Tax=Maribacter dokdonensis TaxID=320912 RepID=UPI0007198E90|nr:hypothetical protein [Maribacter dokdonensis]KSA15308.1 hypothetical protein I600_1921 [Maribacter dokdonensis DSW-8]